MHRITLSGPVGDEHFSVRQVTDIPPGQVRIIIESAGGCLITAFAIYRLLIEHPGPVTTKIIYAGSAATLVAMGGGRRLINSDGYFFLHRTWGVAIGTANTLRKVLAEQDEWDAAVAAIYQERTDLSLERVYELLDGETTLDAKQALTLGFADEILGEPQDVVHSTTPERTALGCLQFEDASRTLAVRTQCNYARPVARRHPGAAAVLDASIKQKPKIPPGLEAKAFSRFCENERRETEIRRALAARLRRVIDRGGHITWPVRVDWRCRNCGKTNFHPPAQNKLATPCRTCGATSPEGNQS